MQNKEYWIRLSDKYFEALTSEQEEQELRQFAAKCQDPDFNELRAVMGFLEVGRAESKAVIRHKTFTRALAVAATFTLVMGISLFILTHLNREQDDSADFYAYTNGMKITDHDQAFDLMVQTLQGMETISQEELPTVEEQLGDIFDGL